MVSIFKIMLEITMFSSIMIAAILLLRLVFQSKLSIKTTMFLWILVMIRLILPFTIQSPIQIMELFPERTKIENQISTEEISNDVSESNTQKDDSAINQTQESNSVQDTQQITAKVEPQEIETTKNKDGKQNIFNELSMIDILAIVWFIGVFVALIINIIWVVRFSCKVRKSAFLSDKLIAQKIYNDCHKLNIGKNVSVYECDYVDSPITCGVFRPKILLSADLIKIVGAQKAELIIFHELIHIKNFDILKNYVWMIAKIIYWFNPLVYLGYNRYLEDVELYTDNTVKEKHSKQEILHYSQGLLDVIKLSQGEIKLPTAMPFCKTKIRKRVETMLKPQKKWKVATIASYVVITLLIVSCFTTACMKATATNEVVDSTKSDAKEQVKEDHIIEKKEKAPALIDISKSVGGPNDAIEIAKTLNLSNAQEFEYGDLWEYVLPEHAVYAVDDMDAHYSIYDFNGEFKSVGLKINHNEQDAVISEKQAEDMAYEYIEKVYGDVEVTIDECNISDGKRFHISGSIYKQSEDSTREMFMVLNGEGKLCSISAEYDPFFVLGIDEKVKEIALSYSQYDDVALELTAIKELDGEDVYEIHLRFLDEGKVASGQGVYLSASDNSLVEYTFANDAQRHEKMNLSEVEISELSKSYLARYFPQYSDLSIEKVDVGFSEGFAFAPIVKSNYYVSISIYPDKALKNIKIIDGADLNPGDGSATIAEIEAAKASISTMYNANLADKELVFIKKYSDPNDLDCDIYEFEYYASECDVYDYSIIALVTHNKSKNEYYDKIMPNLEKLDILSMDDAIEAARKIISDQEDIAESKLVCDYNRLIPIDMLFYDISFSKENHGYGLYLNPFTGEEIPFSDVPNYY